FIVNDRKFLDVTVLSFPSIRVLSSRVFSQPSFQPDLDMTVYPFLAFDLIRIIFIFFFYCLSLFGTIGNINLKTAPRVSIEVKYFNQEITVVLSRVLVFNTVL
ncbi:hypothetical protein L9F63_000140, partial [Diploptera punctata]